MTAVEYIETFLKFYGLMGEQEHFNEYMRDFIERYCDDRSERDKEQYLYYLREINKKEIEDFESYERYNDIEEYADDISDYLTRVYPALYVDIRLSHRSWVIFVGELTCLIADIHWGIRYCTNFNAERQYNFYLDNFGMDSMTASDMCCGDYSEVDIENRRFLDDFLEAIFYEDEPRFSYCSGLDKINYIELYGSYDNMYPVTDYFYVEEKLEEEYSDEHRYEDDDDYSAEFSDPELEYLIEHWKELTDKEKFCYEVSD